MLHCRKLVAGLFCLLAGWSCGAAEPIDAESVSAAASQTAAASKTAAASDTWLISGATVVTMDESWTVWTDGAVAVHGDSIEAVGTAEELGERYPDAKTLDARGRLVLPGLINTHTHVPMTLFRGLADDLPLMEWLETVIFPAEAKFVDEEFVRVGTRLACLEMLAGGTTTFADMYFFEDAIAEEAEACGIRAIVGETFIDFPAPDNATWDEAVVYMRAFLERWKGHERIIPAVAPHAPYTVSGEHLQEAHALAAEYGVPMLVHLAEAQSEVETVLERHGMRPVEYLDSLGVLDSRVVANHMIWPSDAEIDTLVEREVGVAHCPESNMKIAAGISPVPKMLAAGVAVGLGTDGAASNNDLDMWDEIDTAAKLHKVANADATVVSAREALHMATLGGAKALGLEELIGSLEPGKRADLIVVDLSGFHQQPYYDPYSALTYSTRPSDVETVVVDGRVVFSDGEVRTLDAQAVIGQVVAYRDRLAELRNR